MAEDKKRFVLYEYLLYFWRRKWFFVIVPLITTILVAGAVYVFKNNPKYTGTALVSTGGVDKTSLTDDTYLADTYKEYKSLKDVIVPKKGLVKFTVQGDSENQVQKDLDDIVKDFKTKLLDNYNLRYKRSEQTQADFENRVKVLKDFTTLQEQRIENGTLAGSEYGDAVQYLLAANQTELTNAVQRVNSIKTDLLLFEKPKVLSVDKVHRTKTYLPEAIAIGIILGLVLTVALLMLLKYLGVARRYYEHD